MKHFENPENQEPKAGVLNWRIENGQYVVTVCWKNGKINEHHFPQRGFEVIDLQTRKSLGHLKGEEALEILQKNAVYHTDEEFCWKDFFPSNNQK
jgi:hypothetical protein